MTFLKKNRIYTGIEIGSKHIRSVLISKNGDSMTLLKCATVTMPAKSLNLSFKRRNIIDPAKFQSSMKKSLKICKGKKGEKGKIGIAIPNSTVKILINKFPHMPDDNREKNEMVEWHIASSLNLSLDEIRVSWSSMGRSKDGENVLLVALCYEDVLSQYEREIKKIGLTPRLLSPAGINQFNFYSKLIPEKGISAYLGIFDDFISIFVFIDGIPLFYKNIKKGFLREPDFKMAGSLDMNTANDVDMLIQYYNAENPDFKIEKIFIASHGRAAMEMEKTFTAMHNIQLNILDERQIMNIGKNVPMDSDNKEASLFSAAAGAAMNIEHTAGDHKLT